MTMKLLLDQLRVFPSVHIRHAGLVVLLAAGALLGAGLLPQFSVGGVSIATFFFLLSLCLYPLLSADPRELRIPRSWLAVPIFLAAIGRIQSPASLEIAARVFVGCLVGLAIIAGADDQSRLRRFLQTVALGSVAFLLVLDYHSIWVFRVPFLTADIEIPTRAGRNSVGFLLSIAMPAVFAFRGAVLRVLLLGFFLANAVYLQSRGVLLAFASAACAAVAVRLLLSLKQPLLPLGRQVSLTAVLVPVAVAGFGYFARGRIAEFLKAFVFVAHTSDDLRLRLSSLALEAFRRHPLAGIGVGRFQYYSPEGLLTHNDYLAVLAECGVLGFLPFVVIVGAALFRGLRLLATTARPGSESTASPMLAQGMISVSLATYLFVINGYSALVFWVAMGVVHAGRDRG